MAFSNVDMKDRFWTVREHCDKPRHKEESPFTSVNPDEIFQGQLFTL